MGLGKTIEVGILLSELIRRGRAKRILVLALKSMLTQFQKELWSRFTIPLTRLDSIGIQRIKNQIPSNHNPFYYYDKSIISIDTLKQDTEYRTYLENCYWDVIVIDEAQHVAVRSTKSMRSRLAQLLRDRSDTLIMLSATPHDGSSKSFASLMNMLNPTAIANPEKYGPEDINGLFIRRFKKDIIDQVKGSFQNREKIEVRSSMASDAEEEAFQKLVNLKFSKIDSKKRAGMLFKTTLEKSLFSSPAACLETIENRLKKIRKENQNAHENDIILLESLKNSVAEIDKSKFSRYQLLLDSIRDHNDGFGWTGKDSTDRLVIFTERIKTLDFLQNNLKNDLGLKDNQVEKLHGAMPDVDMQKIVENFGNEDSPIRLLIASDTASEGINLHFLSHKMIHFDIPWSLMVFQQRNGRIDRYGQERKPRIHYLMTGSVNPKIKGDNRILEILIRKEEQAFENIGDPASLMGKYDIGLEEERTAEAIESGESVEEFETSLNEDNEFDPLALLMTEDNTPIGDEVDKHLGKMPSLFQSNYDYCKEAMGYIKRYRNIQVDFDDSKQTFNLTFNRELDHRYKRLSKEIKPDNGELILTEDRIKILEEIKEARKEENLLLRMQLLWEIHPVVGWLNDKLASVFGRQEAPFISLEDKLQNNEVIYLIYGLIPNKRSHPMIQRWFGLQYIDGAFNAVLDFDNVLEVTRIHEGHLPNHGREIRHNELKRLLPDAIKRSKEWMGKVWKDFEDDLNIKLDGHLNELDRLKEKQFEQLEKEFGEVTTEKAKDRKAQRKRDIDRIFEDFFNWIDLSMTTENNPYIRVVAAFTGE